MVKSLRELIVENLLFLTDGHRAQVVAVRDKYASVLGAKANEYIYSIIKSGFEWAQRENMDCRVAFSSLVEKMDEFYVLNVEGERFDRERKAELILTFIQDRLNVQLKPGYESAFEDSDPGYYGLKESLN